MNETMISKIKEIAEKYTMDYEKIGIRFQDEAFGLGPIGHVSNVWVDGEDTGEEMDGISVFGVDALGRASTEPYEWFDHIAVIGGNDYVYGEDAGELVISDPVVLGIIK